MATLRFTPAQELKFSLSIPLSPPTKNHCGHLSLWSISRSPGVWAKGELLHYLGQ